MISNIDKHDEETICSIFTNGNSVRIDGAVQNGLHDYHT